MGENWLEVKVMYCNDLKLFNFFQKLSVYALVSLLTDDDDDNNDKGGGGGGGRSDKEGDKNNEKAKVKLKLKKQQQRTPTDTEGDANPEWNHEIRFDLGSSFNSLDDFNDDRLFLHFDLRSEATGLLAIGGDRSIGEVWVPLKDLIQPHNLNGIARFVNYEVRTLDGKSNGVINFSFKLNFKQNSPHTNLPPINIHGYPIHHHHHHHHANIDQDQNPPSSPVNLYPPSPSLYSPSSELYYDAVTSPMTPYSPQQAFHQYQYPQPHPFSPLRPPQPVPYPHEFSQPPPPPPPPQQPMPYAYPPPPHEYQAPPPNWAQYPHPPDPHYCAPSSAGGGYDYGLVPGSPGPPPIGSQTTWPNHHFQPPVDHFPPPWNSR